MKYTGTCPCLPCLWRCQLLEASERHASRSSSRPRGRSPGPFLKFENMVSSSKSVPDDFRNFKNSPFLTWYTLLSRVVPCTVVPFYRSPVLRIWIWDDPKLMAGSGSEINISDLDSDVSPPLPIADRANTKEESGILWLPPPRPKHQDRWLGTNPEGELAATVAASSPSGWTGAGRKIASRSNAVNLLAKQDRKLILPRVGGWKRN